MIRKNIYKLVLLLCVLCTYSCDDLLTTPPLDKITDEQWWKDKSQVQMMVNSCYAELYGINEVAMRDCITDNAKHREGHISSVGNGSFDTQNTFVKAFWKYGSIAKLNYVLEGISKSKEFISDDDYRQLSAQVRFIRAFVYYDMVFYFGDVPLITKVLSVEESRQTSRQPRQEVLTFILNELENVVLKDIVVAAPNETGRVNVDVVNAFLTRIYLHEKNYDKTIQYADAVIGSSKGYTLYANYDMLFRPQSDGVNKEVIFERQYKAPLYVHELNRNLSSASSVYNGWSHVLLLQNLVDEFECINGHSTKDCERLGCEYFVKRNAAENNTDPKRGEYMFRDPRFYTTVVYPFWEWKVGDNVRSVYGVDQPGSKDYVKAEVHMTGYMTSKWLDLTGENADRTRSYKNLTIIRYADVLLMKSEALIEKGQDLDVAAGLINSIRTRAGLPANVTVTSQAELRDKLRHERRIELAIEGLRYYDIIRWKIAGDVRKGVVYGARMKAAADPAKPELGPMPHKKVEERFWEDKMYLFPIPQEARDNNPNLTQNKDW